jgi:guanylate kinase
MTGNISFKKTTGTLFVISGPSGVGKGTILKQVFEQVDRLIFSVSATTRHPRPGEIDGVDYFFIKKDDFEKMLEGNRFLEWAEVHENYYGTPVEFVDKKLDEGIDVVLDIDTQGAAQVMKNRPGSVFIFIAPPMLDVNILRKRLMKRSTESRESMEIRLKNAEMELTTAANYEYIIFNDTVEEASEDLKAIIRAQRYRTERIFDKDINQETGISE